ncbi:DsbA family oxidoreductase [Curvivirga aplysinae]|uniref:DsbA family oxidoreductase n=1 Tax=Curvivirga aplysinae TaxID=2529852 RepID=UPI0012BC12BE|nr:DsbA family oxidoreductase [Curvivirga aplysinae]MTI10916.1 DsbA family oxidoreductase [Curvivirga aplysinae]
MKPFIHIDIISDVVCPWCVVGYKRLLSALEEMQGRIDYQIQWHPFELNPDMEMEGENLRDHIIRKYNSSPEQSANIRETLIQYGLDLGFQFNFFDDMRIYNTFTAHQLLHWALKQGKQTDLKLALFDAYFTHQKNISESETLLDVVGAIGLDKNDAKSVLEDGRYVEAVRENQRRWLSLGIQGVPAVVLDNKYLISGAQEASYFKQALEQCLEEVKTEDY